MCSVRSGLVKLSAAQIASEHTQRSSGVKSSFTYSQKSFVIRSWVSVFRERPFLKASCIVYDLTYRVEVSSVPDKSWFAGLYPEREVDARSGLGLGVRYR